MLFRSMSFVVEAQFVLLLSKKECACPVAMLVPVLIISSVWCHELNVLFTKKTQLNSVSMRSPNVHIRSYIAVFLFLSIFFLWLCLTPLRWAANNGYFYLFIILSSFGPL